MKRIFTQQIVILSVVTFVALCLVVGFWQDMFTNHTPMCVLATSLLVFDFIGILTAFLVKRKYENKDSVIQPFMVMKSVKLLVSLVVILIYFLAIKINIKVFVVCFAVVYIVYLALDTMFISRVNNIKTLSQQIKE